MSVVLSEHLPLLALAPDGVQKLRGLILELAVRGKLVPQDPDDEPARELLRRIAKERMRLEAEGICKKSKVTPLEGEEDLPFALPHSWEWAPLGGLGVIGSSSRVHQKDWTDQGVPFYRAREIVKLSQDGFVQNELFISKRLYESLAASGLVPVEDDLMVTGVGTIGVPYIVKAADRFYFKDASVLIFKNYHRLCADYIRIFMTSPYWVKKIHEKSMGTTVHTLTIVRANEVPVPLPPLAEQHRIVAKVDELMALCDRLEAEQADAACAHARLVETLLGTLTQSTDAADLAANWQRLAEHFDTLFTTEGSIDALKQSILQLAVMGKLVPQDPNDEPASELLKQIALEQERLVAKGLLKKLKSLPPVDEADVPFALPNSWAWARFPEVGQFGRGKSKHRPRNDPALFNPGIYPLVQTGEVARAGTIVHEIHSKYSDVGLSQSKMWPKGTLCITIAANIADTAILGFDACFPDSVVGFVPSELIEDSYYFLWFMKTAREELLKFAPSTAQKNINLEILESVRIPLPPQSEMQRIVAKVDELMVLCDRLKTDLATARQRQATLADTLIELALEAA